jgi:arginine-tRNA-protein transferase
VRGRKIIAYSFFHVGHDACSATYALFNPDFCHLSLGTYTLLLEIQRMMQLGKKYYYHGYCYNVPSQFDYKLNFFNLERYQWKTASWVPQDRLAVRSWRSLTNVGNQGD